MKTGFTGGNLVILIRLREEWQRKKKRKRKVVDAKSRSDVNLHRLRKETISCTGEKFKKNGNNRQRKRERRSFPCAH